MKIKKIAFASLIFVASFALNNTIMPMERKAIKKNIKSNLIELEKKIRILEEDVKTEEQDDTQQKDELATNLENLEKKLIKQCGIIKQMVDDLNACVKKESKNMLFDCNHRMIMNAIGEANREKNKIYDEEYFEAYQAFLSHNAHNASCDNIQKNCKTKNYIDIIIEYRELKRQFITCKMTHYNMIQNPTYDKCLRDLNEEVITLSEELGWGLE